MRGLLDENSLLLRRDQQHKWLSDYIRQLVNVTDINVSGQKAAEWLQRILDCEFVAIFRHQKCENRLVMLTAVGPESTRIREKMGERWVQFPHSLTGGLIGHSIRLAKVQISNEPDATLDLLQAGGLPFRSLIAAPLYLNGHLEGVILLADTQTNYFKAFDEYFVDQVCFHLMVNWNQVFFHERENEVIRAISNIPDKVGYDERRNYAVLQGVADITRQILGARIAICGLYEDPDWICKHSGGELRVIQQNPVLQRLMGEILDSEGAFRLRDLRRDPRTAELELDFPNQRSLLACRFMMYGEPGGIILAIGNETSSTYTEKDEVLLDLIATNASMAVTRFITNKELRDTLENLTIIHEISQEIAKSRELENAIRSVALKAFKRFEAISGGLALVRQSDGKIGASVKFPEDDPETVPPEDLIYKAIASREQQNVPGKNLDPDCLTTISVYPIYTQDGCYGALWLELRLAGARFLTREDQILALIKQTAVALESAVRNDEISIRNTEISLQNLQITDAFAKLTQAHVALEKSNNELSETYEQMIYGFIRSLDAREGETAIHSVHLGDLALLIGQKLNLDPQELKHLKYGANLHDIGKVGVPDHIFMKSDKLTPEEWVLMREHAAKGAMIVHQIPGLQGATEVIANHHELWDGSGYPCGKKGAEIPLLARIVTVVDVYDAITNERPYRKDVFSHEEAVAYLSENAGKLYDPAIVDILKTIPVEQLRR
jgi:HD-GYP domain-containing protein (c-di-GMP phosphodiesterase class II)